MYWNYRIVKNRDPKISADETFRIAEVYYEGADIIGLVLNPGSPMGDSVEEAKDDFEGMGWAFRAPMLDYDETMEKMMGQPWPYPVEARPICARSTKRPNRLVRIWDALRRRS